MARTTVVARRATDPSTAGSFLGWQQIGGFAFVHRGAGAEQENGTHPALGGPWLALRSGTEIVVIDRTNRSELTRLPGAGSGPLAVSDGWAVVRVSDADGDRLEAIRLRTGERDAVVAARPPREIGRPALDGTRLVFHEITRAGSRIREVDLRGGRPRTLRASRGALLLNPSLRDGRLLYVHSSAQGQRLRAGSRGDTQSGRSDRTLHEIAPTARRDSGHEPGRHRHRAGYRGGRSRPLPPRPPEGVTQTLWTTALGNREAYVARLSHDAGGAVDGVLLRVG